METLKVLHLSSEKTWRGGEQQIAYLIEALTGLGITNYVAVRTGSAFEVYCKENNITVFPVAYKSSVDLKTAKTIKLLCKQMQINVVHAHSSKSHSMAVLSELLGNTVPLVLSRRVDFIPKNSWFTKWKYNHHAIKKIVCVSDKINEIMHCYLKEPSKSITIHDGVNLAKFNSKIEKNILRTEYGIDVNTSIIANTSALEDHKDYITFINTLEILCKENLPVHAFIIGKGSLENPLKKLVDEKGLSSKITFTGFRNDIVDILTGIDVFFMPSKEEGLGTSILDAFLARIPVVATVAGGIPEIVIHEKTGLLASIGNANELAKQIKRLIIDKDLKSKLIANAYQKVKDFSKEATALKTLEVYREAESKKQKAESGKHKAVS